MKAKKRLHFFAAAFTIAVLFLFWYLKTGQEAPVSPMTFLPSEEETGVKETPELDTLTVYVSGAVVSPGVYFFQEGDRAFLAVEKAGGFTEDADRDAVNLALPLKDGEQLRIPRRTEEHGSNGTGDPRVNINTADVEELMKLSGIGEAKARAIIAYRTRNGPFESPEELKNVSGIGAAIYQNIAEEICTE